MTEAALDLLAERLDTWFSTEGVSVTENGDRLTVRQLSGLRALELLGLLDEAALPIIQVRDAGGPLERAHVDEGSRNVQVQADLPAAPAGVERILTLAAFRESLRRDALPGRIWVRHLARPFETLSARFGPWGDGEREAPVSTCSTPLKVMRALGPYDAVDADLCRWLLADPETFETPESSAYLVWRARAGLALARSIANEIEHNGDLLFRGPPLSRFNVTVEHDLPQSEFMNLQRAVRWTYANSHELEQRHTLISAEIARVALRSGDLQNLAEVAGPALDGARIAYAFGVQQQSRETLKALSDLRKAVLDEAAKLTDITRGLVAAVAGAVLGGVGLMVARVALPNTGVFVRSAALLLGLVLVLHVLGTIISGAMFVSFQKSLRKQWRSRLYAFLGDTDYKTLVTDPVAKAEKAFWVSAGVGATLTTLTFVASLLVFWMAPSQSAAPPPPEALAPPPEGANIRAQAQHSATPGEATTAARPPS
jgi:hypothetical protein